MDSGLWHLPPVVELTTKPAIIQKMWGLYESSKRYLNGEWADFPKLELETSNTIWKFYRHAELFTSVRCDKLRQKYWYNRNEKIPTEYEKLSGWDRQAMQLYSDCYNSALKLKQEIEGV